MLVLCYLFPPLAVLLMGKPFSAVINVFLTGCCFWIPGVKHALICYADYKAEQQFGRVVDAVNNPTWVQAGGARQGGGPTVVNNYYSNEVAPEAGNPYVGSSGTVFRRKS